MNRGVGWSRSRRWLLETCARRFVLTYPGGSGKGGPLPEPNPRLGLRRLLDAARRDLLEDRSEGHAWSPRLHRVVLERRMDDEASCLELDAVGRRKEAREEVRRMATLLRHPWMAHHVPVGGPCSLPSSLEPVQEEDGLLWAAPSMIVGKKKPRIVLLREGRHRGPVDDLEAAINFRWTASFWSHPLDRTVTVMRRVGASWIHRMVLVTPDMEASAAALLDHDRRAFASVRRRWQRYGISSLPLASSAVHCRRCPFAEGCPGGATPAVIDQARRAPSTKS